MQIFENLNHIFKTIIFLGNSLRTVENHGYTDYHSREYKLSPTCSNSYPADIHDNTRQSSSSVRDRACIIWNKAKHAHRPAIYCVRDIIIYDIPAPRKHDNESLVNI